MASSTEPESSGYHSESVHESELELQDRPSVARDLMDVLRERGERKEGREVVRGQGRGRERKERGRKRRK